MNPTPGTDGETWRLEPSTRCEQGEPARNATASPWLERLTRAGYVARGILYLVIGSTGLLVAVGLADEARGSQGVMRLVASLPMGSLLIFALGIGLAGYSILSLIAATRAPEGVGGLGGMLLRAGDAIAGITYAGLVALAVRLLGDPLATTRVATEAWAERLMHAPGAHLLLGVAGVSVCAAAVYLLYKAVAMPALARFDPRLLPSRWVPFVAMSARLGTGARGVLFAVCGWLLLRAGWTGEPRSLGSLGGALDELATVPAGRAAVGLVAAGCVAYGAYQFAKARWRRLRLGNGDDTVVASPR